MASGIRHQVPRSFAVKKKKNRLGMDWQKAARSRIASRNGGISNRTRCIQLRFDGRMRDEAIDLCGVSPSGPGQRTATSKDWVKLRIVKQRETLK